MPLPGQPTDPQDPNPDTDATKAASEDQKQTSQTEDTTAIKDELAKLQSENSQLKNQLLDDDYIAYLESKKNKAEPEKPKEAPKPTNFLGEELTQAELDSLTPSQVLKLAEKNLGSSIIDAVRSEFSQALQSQNQAIETIVAHMELQQVKSENPDFDDYKDDVAKILQESKTSISIQDALDKAKITRARTGKDKTDTTPAPKTTPASSEKPGAHLPSQSLKKKEFKTEAEAAAAALEEVSAKHGISGDTI